MTRRSPASLSILPRAARDAAILAAFTARDDVSQREVARAFGVSRGVIERVLANAGVRDTNRASAVHKRLHAEGFYATVNTGRKPVWPNCPPEIERTWRNLQKKGVSAVDARRVLDPGFQA